MISQDRQRRFEADLIDSYDEELEMEVDDRLLDGESALSEEARELRKVYFRELFRLQGELVKLQDWVVNTGHQGRRDVRRPRRRRQGRRDQAHHAAAQSARVPRRCAPRAERSRANAVVLPALRVAFAGRAARSCCSIEAGTTARASSA